ncbi:MAG: nucleotidyltransferase [Nitrososphaerota archaeon]
MENYELENIKSKLLQIKKIFKENNILWMIFAGTAAYCYGSKRKITDIDILVRSVDLEKAKNALKNIKGIDIIADLRIIKSNKTYLFSIDNEMIERIKYRKLFDIEVPLIPVEDNIILKAILQRSEKEGKHDIEDIKSMVENERIDFKYLKERIKKYQVEEIVLPVLEKLGIKLS